VSDLRAELAASGAAVLAEEAAGGAEGYRVKPRSVVELARAVGVLRSHRLPVRVRGAGDEADSPLAGGALLELAALDRIASVDGEAGVAHVEAGCSVAALEAAARREGCTLGPLLPSVRAGSVGHWLAGPTRGERGVPGARRETAALSIAVVLDGARIAESRAAPRSATGPDLDHLALGAGGRTSVIAGAWIRLLPEAPLVAAVWDGESTAACVAALERLCLDRLAPARARLDATPHGGARLAAAWEGARQAPLHRERAARALRESVPELREATEGGDWAAAFLLSPAAAHAVEVDARWDDLRSWAAQPAASAPGADLSLCGLHAGGAFAVLSVPGAETHPGEACAASARGAGARILAPRRLRDHELSWERMGAGDAWKRLLSSLGSGWP
jgi:FAD/FMN-containing dehydrogenase